jgi:hypothetical protein
MEMKRLRLKMAGVPSTCSALYPTASGQARRIVFTRKGKGKLAKCNDHEVDAEWAAEKLEPLGWFEEVPVEVAVEKPAVVSAPAKPAEPAKAPAAKPPVVESKPPAPSAPKPPVETLHASPAETPVVDDAPPGAGSDGDDDPLGGEKPTVAELVNSNTKEVLQAMAAERNLVLSDRANKSEIATAILENW